MTCSFYGREQWKGLKGMYCDFVYFLSLVLLVQYIPRIKHVGVDSRRSAFLCAGVTYPIYVRPPQLLQASAVLLKESCGGVA